jgi:riboflavin kinase/FMN adenylyltransferase
LLVTSNPAQAQKPTAIALGNFDGLHRGHQQVIAQILSPCPGWEELGDLDSSSSCVHNQAIAAFPPNCDDLSSGDGNNGNLPLIPTVVTFDPHPREFFSKTQRSLLTPLPEKIALLEQMGIKQLVLLPFGQALAELSADDFIQKILIEQLAVQQISVGHDFGFGYQRSRGVWPTCKRCGAIAFV